MVDHILRRIGFGASARERAAAANQTPLALIATLLDYEQVPDDVDANIGKSAFVGVTTRGRFSPNTVISDARQRELFRMIHGGRPLQEKMALFWHNHFATAYGKIALAFGPAHATKMMAGKQGEIAGNQRGQYDLFRQMGTGHFRDLLLEVAKDPAMLEWLDGRQNTRERPQENFGREIMELFTLGIGNYVESDVYAAARAFTGWSLRLSGDRNNPETSYYEFVFNADEHDVDAKAFTFAIYRDGGRTIPARPPTQGMQDGVDLINALTRHPATAHRFAAKLYRFFVSDIATPNPQHISDLANTFMQTDYSIKAVLRRLLTSAYFLDSEFSRYSWPVEYVVRAIKETGWNGLSVDTALTPLANMGQLLYEPPDVNGWALGSEWFTTASMLARMNFAATLMANQWFNLGRELVPHRESPGRVLDYMLNRFTYAPLPRDAYNALVEYAHAGGAWTGSDVEVRTKGAGLARLIVAAPEYQFM
jgi:uncharacterized protein (DUF1800 family)